MVKPLRLDRDVVSIDLQRRDRHRSVAALLVLRQQGDESRFQRVGAGAFE
jgi:hypothetical protein